MEQDNTATYYYAVHQPTLTGEGRGERGAACDQDQRNTW